MGGNASREMCCGSRRPAEVAVRLKNGGSHDGWQGLLRLDKELMIVLAVVAPGRDAVRLAFSVLHAQTGPA